VHVCVAVIFILSEKNVGNGFSFSREESKENGGNAFTDSKIVTTKVEIHK